MDLTYFNPNLQKEPDFLATFVARQTTLAFFLQQLRMVAQGQTAKHHLIIAPRGFGKTSLLRRIALGVREDAQLHSSFIALRFREEQHNVLNLDVFFRNCLQSLAEAREDEGADASELDHLDQLYTQHAPRQDLSTADQDGHPAWEDLRQACEQLNRRPLLLIDNLDTLLAGLPPTHQWGLRKHLQREDGPVLLAAASRYPETTHNADAAFYDFFRIQTLGRLEDREVFACLRNLAHQRGDAGQPVLKLLDQNPGRISALNTLAGGNPRTLSVLYGVLESHMSDDILSQLSAMLDTFTGWYQARTEELPMQSRAVFDALALNWGPMTAANLGKATGLDTTAVSSQLNRLEKSGYVEQVSLTTRGKGRSGFQVSERFFNIWYLMRNGSRRARQKIRFLTAFLQACFSKSERQAMARSALQRTNRDLSYTLALASSLHNSNLRQELLEQARDQLAESPQAAEYMPLLKNFLSEPKVRQSTPGTTPIPTSDEQVAWALANKSVKLHTLGQHQEAMAICDELVQRFNSATEPGLLELVARVFVVKGVTLNDLGQHQEAMAVYDELVQRFGTATEPGLLEQVAQALFNKGVTLGNLGQHQEAMAVYDEVLQRFGTASEPALLEQVARALFNKGVTLGNLGQHQEAMAVYDEVLQRFGTASESALLEQVARALIGKGFTLGTLGQHQEAMAIYDMVMQRFGTATESGLLEPIARALFNKGNILHTLGQNKEAMKAYDDVVQRFGTATEFGLLEWVAQALFNKGVTLGNLGQHKEAMAVYDEVVQRFDTATEPGSRRRVASALSNKANTLLNYLGDHKAAAKILLAGLEYAHESDVAVLLHANLAYALGLHSMDYAGARVHGQAALEGIGRLSAAGRELLQALPIWSDSPEPDWSATVSHICAAVETDDPHLWDWFADDLHRLLWYVHAHGQGELLIHQMEARDFQTKYAPLYHAQLAVIHGEDHLLKINLETRGPAIPIYQETMRRLKLFA